MKVLVAGGTGVVGEGAVLELVRAGHVVRLLARGAEAAAKEWPKGVEPFAADVTDVASLRGAADGCDAVVQITGVVDERPPEVTYDLVNVEGTRHVVAEAERAGVGRFVYVSSLGAERGSSDYHRSKRKAEAVVRASALEWVIRRPGNVYGPGDEVISTYLKMFRVFPAVPVVGDGRQPFQPVWYRDLGVAIAKAVDTPDLGGRTLEIAGGDTTTMQDLADRFERITGRQPTRVPIPETLASIGIDAASVLGVDIPINDAMLKMLVEENVVRAPEGNALVTVFGVAPTPIDDALEELAKAIPEQEPAEGVGELEQKRFYADIERASVDGPGLIARIRENFAAVMPIEVHAEPGSSSRVERGATLTLGLPGRGNVQVRVLESTAARITLGTVEGHPLAGVVRFHADTHGKRVLFEVETITRSGSVMDFVAMKTIGNYLQKLNWIEVVERVVETSGGEAPNGVEHAERKIGEEEARQIEEEISELVRDLRRDVKEAKLEEE
jgi:NADH dehydrogenase